MTPSFCSGGSLCDCMANSEVNKILLLLFIKFSTWFWLVKTGCSQMSVSYLPVWDFSKLIFSSLLLLPEETLEFHGVWVALQIVLSDSYKALYFTCLSMENDVIQQMAATLIKKEIKKVPRCQVTCFRKITSIPWHRSVFLSAATLNLIWTMALERNTFPYGKRNVVIFVEKFMWVSP